MAQPAPIGAVLGDMNPLGTREFPFYWWALGAKFDYPDGAKHLFAKTGSAAEAYFFRPFSLMPGVEYLTDRLRFGSMMLVPQHRVAKSRIDFALLDRGRAIAIEVDGRAFHHMTNAQIDADYLRQRRVTAAGFSVIRFTASEVFRNAEGCWEQAKAVLDRIPATFPTEV